MRRPELGFEARNGWELGFAIRKEAGHGEGREITKRCLTFFWRFSPGSLVGSPSPGLAATSAEEPAPKASPIAGICRRVAAALFDSAVLGSVGFMLWLYFVRQFMAWGSWGRLLGFAIALLYFGPLNSRLGGGQTIGKRALKIRVTTAAGAGLGLGRSPGRARDDDRDSHPITDG